MHQHPPAAVAALMLGIIAMALATLLLPLRGVRRRVRRAKAEELARVDEAIRGQRRALLTPGDPNHVTDGPPAASLADLLAYRELVTSVREWPLDATTIARFGLYVAIGLGSWVGAAMVERLVDALLS